jgi:hypothetical protein
MTLIIQKPTGAKLVLSKIQQYPAVLGEPFGGGYFAGYISHTADGNPTHALIVAPRSTGATGTGYTLITNPTWKTTNTTTAGTTSSFDGAANTAAMVAAGITDHPAAEFCVNLSIGGFTDWYLPARWELDIAYFNLKPSVAANITAWGINDYSVPKRTANYTPDSPAQTAITGFLANESQAFVTSDHWSSTEVSPFVAWSASLNNGGQNGGVGGITKTSTSRRVRAFRRIAL